MNTQKITIEQALQQAAQKIISASGLPLAEARIEARTLLLHTLQQSHAWLISHGDDMLSERHGKDFHHVLARRLEGEPIAYILGYREFFGLQLKVSPATLIPRQDTEILVETALALIPSKNAWHIADLGTGSGAIALAIAHQRPDCQLWATDQSEEALTIAQENARLLQVNNTHFRHGSWFAPLTDLSFDLIVSNPPYIPQQDAHLTQGDLRFEPLSALASGHDGLDDIRSIIQQSKQHLSPHGFLLLEHGFDQAQAIANIAYENQASHVSHIKDLAGLDRVSQIQF